jgi:hypothetical protein
VPTAHAPRRRPSKFKSIMRKLGLDKIRAPEIVRLLTVIFEVIHDHKW